MRKISNKLIYLVIEMSENKRSKQEREHDLVIVAQMYFQGKYQKEIGAKLGLSQQQISYDLAKLHKRWTAASLLEVQKFKARELARIDHLERVYWESWEDSTKIINESGKFLGDKRFLDGVQWCIAKRCEILGLNAASKSLNVDMSALSDSQVERLAAGEDLISVIADSSTS